ncbi:MAG: N-acetyltransferase [Opitutae bacterium]|jgi:predicted GNAT family acetyltransferase|nr:N-acetyltransferase [Opitutae bacterium]
MPTVHHCSDHARFEIAIGEATAVLEYTRSDSLMTIHHTYVPVELRGQNIAGLLAKAAFDSARAEQLQVLPLCSYIAGYAKRFPEAGALVV